MNFIKLTPTHSMEMFVDYVEIRRKKSIIIASDSMVILMIRRFCWARMFHSIYFHAANRPIEFANSDLLRVFFNIINIVIKIISERFAGKMSRQSHDGVE